MATAEPSSGCHWNGWGRQVWKLLTERGSITETRRKTTQIQRFSSRFPGLLQKHGSFHNFNQLKYFKTGQKQRYQELLVPDKSSCSPTSSSQFEFISVTVLHAVCLCVSASLCVFRLVCVCVFVCVWCIVYLFLPGYWHSHLSGGIFIRHGCHSGGMVSTRNGKSKRKSNPARWDYCLHVHSGHSTCNIILNNNHKTRQRDRSIQHPSDAPSVISRWQLISGWVFRWCSAPKRLIWIIMLTGGRNSGWWPQRPHQLCRKDDCLLMPCRKTGLPTVTAWRYLDLPRCFSAFSPEAKQTLRSWSKPWE